MVFEAGDKVITDTSLTGTVLAGPEQMGERTFYWVVLNDRRGVKQNYPTTFVSHQLKGAQ